MKRGAILSVIVAVLAFALSRGVAQTPRRAAPLPIATTLPSGWDQIDERFVFLTVRLASVEASMQAVDKAIKITGYSKGLREEDAEHARRGNEIMDRKGGGPVPWADFYGKTAEKFFYHPTDRNSTYHTETALGQQSPQNDTTSGSGVASRQGLPVAQRPPQLDYIYRANSDNQRRAEQAAADLGGKIDKLLERRRQLEGEQSALWCQIAFQAVASRDLLSKPLYRFDLKSAEVSAAEHLEATRATCDFVRTVNQLMGDAQQAVDSNQEQVFQQLATAVSAARESLMGRLLQQESLTLDLSNPQSQVGKVAACAKRVDDLAKDILESYRLAADGDKEGDDQRKNTFRGQLQDKLISSAEAVFTMDQCVLEMVKDWNLIPDVKKPIAAPAIHLSAASSGSEQPRQTTGQPGKTPQEKPAPTVAQSNDEAVEDLLPQVDLEHDVLSGHWKKDGGLIVGGNGHFIMPYLPKGDYDCRIRATRLEDRGSMEIYLPRDGRAAAFFDIGRAQFEALSLDGKKTPLHRTPQNYQPLHNGRTVSLLIKVRDNSVSFWVNGVELVDDRHEFALIKHLASSGREMLLKQSGGRLVFGCWNSHCRIEKMEILKPQ